MDKAQVTAWLNGLTNKQFVEFFYESLASRHIYSLEREYLDSHLVLANACREMNDENQWGAWRLELLCPTPDEDWVDDAPVCQFGEHCGVDTASWAKNSACPICGGHVDGT